MLLDLVAAAPLPGVAWSKLEIWEGSAAADVWLYAADYLDFRKGPTQICEDNEGCKKLSRNYCGHDRCKHLDLRDMLVREHHQRGLTELVSIPTDFQLADPLTKVLAGPAVTKFRNWALRGTIPSDLPAI